MKRLLLALLTCSLVTLAGCDEEGYTSDVALHGSADAVAVPRRFSDLRPSTAPHCAIDDIDEQRIEHCLFRFGPVSAQPLVARLLAETPPADRTTLAAQIGEYARVLDDWVIVRSRVQADGELYRYAVISRDRLFSATSFSEARTYALGTQVSRLTLGQIGEALNSGMAQWRAEPQELVINHRGLLESQLGETISEFYSLREIDDQTQRCAAGEASIVVLDLQAQFGCVAPADEIG